MALWAAQVLLVPVFGSGRISPAYWINNTVLVSLEVSSVKSDLVLCGLKSDKIMCLTEIFGIFLQYFSLLHLHPKTNNVLYKSLNQIMIFLYVNISSYSFGIWVNYFFLFFLIRSEMVTMRCLLSLTNSVAALFLPQSLLLATVSGSSSSQMLQCKGPASGQFMKLVRSWTLNWPTSSGTFKQFCTIKFFLCFIFFISDHTAFWFVFCPASLTRKNTMLPAR